MPVQYQHVKTGRIVRAADGSRLAKLMAKDEGYTEVKEATPKRRSTKTTETPKAESE
jgi:hypothetical protein